ncbi:hypothetical protein LEP1GSC005_0331 [Leptospira santarosai str. ST188]|nr:hypothetical protein LEP1GSC005_0331 [Leptospira santarosai str. ST188]
MIKKQILVKNEKKPPLSDFDPISKRSFHYTRILKQNPKE